MFEAKTSMELFLLEPFTSYMIVLGLMFPARRESKEGKQLEMEMQLQGRKLEITSGNHSRGKARP